MPAAKEDKKEPSAPPKPEEDEKKKKTQKSSSFFTSPLFLTVLLGPLGLAYFVNSMMNGGYNIWYPLPLIGYVRWDIAYGSYVLFHIPMIFSCFRKKLWAWALLALLVALPFAPADVQPVYYTQDPVSLFSSTASADSAKMSVLPSGFSPQQARELQNTTWPRRIDFVHDSTAYFLGFFHWGTNAHIERNARRRPELYSLKYGIEPRLRRRARESHYRLRFPKEIEHVQETMQENVVPLLRRVYARGLQVPEEQVVFGEELVPGLGLPTVVVQYPNILWKWIVRPQTGAAYKKAFETKAADAGCTATPKVKAFFLPVSVPPEAGLRYWKDANTFSDVHYKMGNIYSFDADMVYASLPQPYFETNRREFTMVLQSFGVECDDGRWVLFH